MYLDYGSKDAIQTLHTIILKEGVPYLNNVNVKILLHIVNGTESNINRAWDGSIYPG